MAANLKLLIAYDGTAYKGWQKTIEGPSIEETLTNVLQQILQEELSLDAASRTDAGVHADGQVVSFRTNNFRGNTHRLFMSLNRLLPKDIAVLSVEKAEEDFHATLNCLLKEYHYQVCYDAVQCPKERFYSWHFPRELDLEKMRSAIPFFIGEKDYAAFCNFKKNAKYLHYYREVTEIIIREPKPKHLKFIVRGKNFLYKMVRNIAGALLYVGCGKIEPSEVPLIFDSHDRRKAGVTAAAHGLTLHKLFYK